MYKKRKANNHLALITLHPTLPVYQTRQQPRNVWFVIDTSFGRKSIDFFLIRSGGGNALLSEGNPFYDLIHKIQPLHYGRWLSSAQTGGTNHHVAGRWEPPKLGSRKDWTRVDSSIQVY